MNLTSIGEYEKYLDTCVTTIGVLDDLTPPKRASKGADYFMKLFAKDESGLKLMIMLFRNSIDDLPRNLKKGDTIALVAFNMRKYNLSLQCISTKSSSIHRMHTVNGEYRAELVCPPETNDHVISEEAWKFLRERAKELANFSISTTVAPNLTNIGDPHGKFNSNRIKILSEMSRTTHFADWIAMVICVEEKPRSNLILVALTDFTENTLFCKSHYSSINPTMTFVTPVVCVCSFWDDKAKMAENMVPGNFYLFRNLRCKSRSAESSDKLEFVMHGNGPAESISLVQENDPAYPELSSRRDKYFTTYFEVVPKKEIQMQNKNSISNPSEGHLTKNLNETQDVSSIKSILGEPMIPNKYRVLAKVSGCFPTKLMDFSRTVCTDCQNVFMAADESLDYFICPACNVTVKSELLKFSYFFCLVVSDGTGSIPLLINDIKFLSDIPAVDLRKNKMSLDALRARLEKIGLLFDNEYNLLECRSFGNMCDLGILSYLSENQRVRFRVFDTMLLP